MAGRTSSKPQVELLQPTHERTRKLVLKVHDELQRRFRDEVGDGFASEVDIPLPPILAWLWWRIVEACDEDGRWEGFLPDLVDGTGVSERTVRKALKALNRWGWLRYKSRGRAGARIELGTAPSGPR